jgi:hypothetical protein
MASRIPLLKWQRSNCLRDPGITFLNNTVAGKTVPGKMNGGLMGKSGFTDVQPLFQCGNVMEGDYPGRPKNRCDNNIKMNHINKV